MANQLSGGYPPNPQATPMGPANQWALAATAILTVTTRRVPRYDCLGGAPAGPDEVQTAKTILKNSWGIESREKLESMIEWLATTGHSAEYQKAVAAFQGASPKQRQGDARLAFVGQHGTEIGQRGLLAWDLGRLLAIAGWGFLAGFCNDIEAWGVMLPAADRIRNAYTSWDEYGQHYKLGALFSMPDAAGQIEQALAQLRSAPDSPWKSVPWRLDGAPNVGAAPYGAPVAPGAPGAPTVASPTYGVPPAAGSPYGGGPSPYGGAPMAPTGGAPYGGAPMAPTGAPYGGAPMAPTGAPYGGAPMAPTGGGAPGKSKTGLILGVVAIGVVMLSVVFFVIWHFTHEEHPHPAAPTHEPPPKGHGHH
jgi:hypothetical protein